MKKFIGGVSTGISVPDCDNIEFGNNEFSISIPTTPIEFYINKTFKCPVCGFEAEHHTNAEGEPMNKPLCPVCFRKANIPLMEVTDEDH